MAAHLPGASPAPTLDDIRAAVARDKAYVEAGRTLEATKAFAELEAYPCVGDAATRAPNSTILHNLSGMIGPQYG
jgi:hypothetical protein